MGTFKRVLKAVKPLLLWAILVGGGLGATERPFAGVYVTQVAPAPDGAILEPLDLSIGVFSTVVRGLSNPENVVCGPDDRLYVTEIGTQERSRTVHRLLRYTREGSGRAVVAQWDEQQLRPSTLAFGPNGDLFVGSTSIEPGQPTQGLWRVSAVTESRSTFNPPQPVLAGSAFLSPLPDTFYSVRPLGLLSTGPFAGDLLIVDAPVQSFTSGGRVVRARAPDFDALEGFIPAHPDPDSGEDFKPAGLALTPAGEVLVSDFTNDKVLRYSADGEFLGVFAQVVSPNQLMVAPDGTVYVTNVTFRGRNVRGALFIYDAEGNLLDSADYSLLLRGVTVCPR